ncbi:MAG: nucleotidyltransferase domain-containing protein [Oscillospiraceae bacterium]|nr:nucleotidyltransferase domain-containing protein [Oscillospiraceae bacterium]
MLDKETVLALSHRYAHEVQRMLSPQAIVLFGSYANDTAHAYSDIDIAIILNDFRGNYLETSKQLYKLRRNISADIEPHLLDAADDKSGFVRHVFNTGQVIYQA